MSGDPIIEGARAAAQQALDSGMPVLVVRFTERQTVVESPAVASIPATNGIWAVEKMGWRLEHFNTLKRSGNEWTYVAVFRRAQGQAEPPEST